MHMCIVNSTYLLPEYRLYGIPCDVIALLERSGREGLVKKEKAVFCAGGVYLLESYTFLTESAEVHSFILVGREVSVDAVDGLIGE